MSNGFQFDPAKKRSAYVHVPFCRHRCGYCNFTLVAGRDDLIDRFLEAIEIELSWLGEPQSVMTLFVGGGTPTHLSCEQLERLFKMMRKWLVLPAGAEFSVEANPENITSEKMDCLVEFGVNRLSFGVQSFDSGKLKTLERQHHARQIHDAIESSRQWISNISLDLIFGVPGESRSIWKQDLQSAIHLQPKHVSTYGLTIEKGTQFWNRERKKELRSISEEDSLWMYEFAIDRLSESELYPYEVSNFAKTGFACEHNENYWKGGEYFALGPGASSHLNGVRFTNHQSTTTYLKKVLNGESAIVVRDELDDESRARERLIFGLRRTQGVDVDIFWQENGINIDELCGTIISELVTQGFLEQLNSTLRLTRKGLVVSDSIWPYLL